MDPALLITLMHYRWNTSIVSLLHEYQGAKLITLEKQLQLSRSTLHRCLTALIDQDLIAKNPGHGHPMRPEYLLTAKGKRIAEPCSQLIQYLNQHQLQETALKKWSLPLVAVIGPEQSRFHEMKTALPSITSRALTLSLKELEQYGWIDREVYDHHPPVVVYGLKTRGRSLQHILQQFGN